jgi:hypothetical protein
MDSKHPLQTGDEVPSTGPAAPMEALWRAGQPAPDINAGGNVNPPVDHFEHSDDYTVSLHIGNRDGDGFEQEAIMRQSLRKGFQLEDDAEGNNG